MIPDSIIPPPPEFLARFFVYPVFRAIALPFTAGGSVTSGFRDQNHNAEVGGVANSAHVAGVALDVVGAPADTVASWVKSFPGAFALDEGDHVHLALPRAAAWLILLVELVLVLVLVLGMR